MKLFTLRNLIGALLFMILVGEPAVGSVSGLYTPTGFIVLFALYFLLFLLYEVLAEKYKLTYGHLALLNFGIYSVLITGLLHAEIADYILHPHKDLITTLIRIQCSFFPLFAYFILNKWSHRRADHLPGLKSILLACLLFIIILSLSGKFGIGPLLDTFRTTPILATLFSLGGLTSVVFALKTSTKEAKRYKNNSLLIVSIALLILGAIPTPGTFLVLLIATPVTAIVALTRPALRHSKV